MPLAPAAAAAICCALPHPTPAAPEGQAPSALRSEIQRAAHEIAETRTRIAELHERLRRSEQERETLRARVDAEQKRANRLARQLAAAQRGDDGRKSRREMDRQAPARVGQVAVLHFERGAEHSAGDSAGALAEVREALREAPDARLEIIGHSCDLGSPRANLLLSARRAAGVRDLLIVGGIAPRILDTYGLGEAEPAAANDTPRGRAANRRVEIRIR